MICSTYFVDASIPSHEKYHQVTFTNCVFRNNTLHTLFTVYGNLNVRLDSCIFIYNQLQSLKLPFKMTDSSNQNYMAITNIILCNYK